MKITQGKRALSLILTVSMLLGVFMGMPQAAFADEEAAGGPPLALSATDDDTGGTSA